MRRRIDAVALLLALTSSGCFHSPSNDGKQSTPSPGDAASPSDAGSPSDGGTGTGASGKTTLPGLRILTRGNNGWVGTVTIAADGSRFLTACYDGTTTIPLTPQDTLATYGLACPSGLLAYMPMERSVHVPALQPGAAADHAAESYFPRPTSTLRPGYEYRLRVLAPSATPVP